MLLLLQSAATAAEQTEEKHENSALNTLLFCFLMAYPIAHLCFFCFEIVGPFSALFRPPPGPELGKDVWAIPAAPQARGRPKKDRNWPSTISQQKTSASPTTGKPHA